MVTSLNTDGVLFYQGSQQGSGRPMPTYFQISTDKDTYRLNTFYVMRHNKGAWTEVDPSVLIQGENHGFDNDVEHVRVDGCCEDFYSVVGSTTPIRFTAKPWSHLLWTNPGYFPTELGIPDPRCGTLDLSGFTRQHIYNDLWVCYFKRCIRYDPGASYAPKPMYEQFDMGDWTAMRLDDPAKGRCNIVLSFKSTWRRCYQDGTLYSKKDYEFSYSFPVWSREWVSPNWIYSDLGFSTIPLGSNKDLLDLGDSCYYECLQLLPQIHASARSKAFEDSFNAIDKLDSNNIANAQQLLDLLKTLFTGDIKGLVEIPKTLKDWWLWYRYTYSTTKMDVEEFIEFFSDFKRKFNKQRFTVYSTFDDEREEITVTWTCGVTLHTALKDWVDSIDAVVYKLGLYPGMVNIWDMIPYSFVVDWFLPIGDICNQLETNIRANTDQYVFERINYSIQCSLESRAISGLRYSYYKRWSESAPPPVRFWVGKGTYNPSTKTIIKRACDGVCLFITGG